MINSGNGFLLVASSRKVLEDTFSSDGSFVVEEQNSRTVAKGVCLKVKFARVAFENHRETSAKMVLFVALQQAILSGCRKSEKPQLRKRLAEVSRVSSKVKS